MVSEMMLHGVRGDGVRDGLLVCTMLAVCLQLSRENRLTNFQFKFRLYAYSPLPPPQQSLGN